MSTNIFQRDNQFTYIVRHTHIYLSISIYVYTERERKGGEERKKGEFYVPGRNELLLRFFSI